MELSCCGGDTWALRKDDDLGARTDGLHFVLGFEQASFSFMSVVFDPVNQYRFSYVSASEIITKLSFTNLNFICLFFGD